MDAMVKNIFRRYFVPFLEESFDLNFPVENNKNSAGKKGERRKGKRLKKINDTKFRASFWKRIIKEYLLRLKLNAINYIYIYFEKVSKENCDYIRLNEKHQEKYSWFISYTNLKNIA